MLPFVEFINNKNSYIYSSMYVLIDLIVNSTCIGYKIEFKWNVADYNNNNNNSIKWINNSSKKEKKTQQRIT